MEPAAEVPIGANFGLATKPFCAQDVRRFDRARASSVLMNLLFPDRDKLGRDPLGFLLREAERASAPVLPLALGFHRYLLVTDFTLINEGPFCARWLCAPPSPFDFFAPIEIDENSLNRQIAHPKVCINTEDCVKIVDDITKEILGSLRRGIFSAYRHASFDCWRFSNSVATKLAFAALFGTDSVADEQIFSQHAEIIHSLRDPISFDIILRRHKPVYLKMWSCKHSLHIAHSVALKAYRDRKRIDLRSHTNELTSSVEFISDLAISIS